MANALLAQDKSADKAKSAKPAVKAEKAAENPEKADDGKHPAASRGKLDEKAIAALPAAALLNANEKRRTCSSRARRRAVWTPASCPTYWTRWIWTATRWTLSTTRWRRWASR